jgi:fatty acid CoA ligase FadD28
VGSGLGWHRCQHVAVPIGGATDERVVSVLRDASPSVVLTTSVVVGKVAEYIEPLPDVSAPSVVEVDVLDLDSRKESSVRGDTRPDTAYLQYTSGSTRSPAGVMLSYGNVLANFEQFSADYFADYGKFLHRTAPSCRGCRSTTTWVWYWELFFRSWLDFELRSRVR